MNSKRKRKKKLCDTFSPVSDLPTFSFIRAQKVQIIIESYVTDWIQW